MHLRITLFLTAICYLNASTWTSIGGWDEWVAGETASLMELVESTQYVPDDTTEGPYFTAYSGTSYSLEGSIEFWGLDDWVDYEDAGETFEIELINAPAELAVSTVDTSYESKYLISWTAPNVPTATEYTFTVSVTIYYAEEITEELQGTITLTVLPSLPRISNSNLLTQGFRIQDDPEDIYELQLEVGDPDESSSASQLTLETQDPRFSFERVVTEYWSNWVFEWNDAYPAPQVSELVPLRFWMRDLNDSQERWTLSEQELMIFGYDYERAHIDAPAPTEEAYFGSAIELMQPQVGLPVTAFIQEADSRQVHIYEQSAANDTWQHTQTLVSPVEEVDFGASITSYADLLVIAAPESDFPLNCRVFIYQRASETGQWSLLQTLIPDNEDQAAAFGGTVALDQTPIGPSQYIYTLMVSADQALTDDVATGAVWVYEASDTTTPVFSKTQIIVPHDAEEDDYFGWPLALHGELAAIPSNEDDDLRENSGAVYVYRRQASSGQWQLEQKLKADDADYDDLFGERVAISDHGIFVSAFRKWQGNTPLGAVYQFEYEGGTWVQTRRIRTVEEASMDEYIQWDYSAYLRQIYTVKHFGSSLIAEGDTVLIAGLRQGYGWTAMDRSMVYQFEWDESANDWQEVRALCSRDSDQPDQQGALGNNFGNAQALTMKGDTILAGDLGADFANADDSGRVYSFTTTPTATLPEVPSRDAFFEDLASNASGKHLPTDDADGDGWLNIVEYHSGTDPMVANTAPLSSTHHADYPQLPTFSYLSSRTHAQARPKVMYSRNLEPGSWVELPNARYLPDLKLGNSVQKTIDLSPYQVDTQPLFLRLEYPAREE
ncbi:MAG TPA: hypothetical protein DEA90_06155 [Opitutae bacterium]|nr:hypothetical protein [Puniceicoccaceae bacterium]HBR93729.1 hypothetical protein [Opitutae bacterium]|tara:strand:+ start:3634 stop:6141 length:2508 start_codon:yes stop_codon:yes gene_type:complete